MRQIAGMAGCILSTSNFRELAVCLVTSIRGTPVSCFFKFRTCYGGSLTKDGSPIKKTTTTHVIKT